MTGTPTASLGPERETLSDLEKSKKPGAGVGRKGEGGLGKGDATTGGGGGVPRRSNPNWNDRRPE